MFPREYFPLAIITLLIAAILFVFYRELNCAKHSLAQLSQEVSNLCNSPPTVTFQTQSGPKPIETEIEEDDEEIEVITNERFIPDLVTPRQKAKKTSHRDDK
jgi:hypothetical protein